MVRPPGFEPGRLLALFREAIRSVAGLRQQISSAVPVLDQARLRPQQASDASDSTIKPYSENPND